MQFQWRLSYIKTAPFAKIIFYIPHNGRNVLFAYPLFFAKERFLADSKFRQRFWSSDLYRYQAALEWPLL